MNNTEKLFHYLGKALGWEYENGKGYRHKAMYLSLFEDIVTLAVSGALVQFDLSHKDISISGTIKNADSCTIHRVQIILQNYNKTPLEIARELVGDTFSIYAISDESFEVGGILEYHDGKININSSFEHSNLIHQLLNRLQP